MICAFLDSSFFEEESTRVLPRNFCPADSVTKKKDDMEMWREELRRIFPNPQERKRAIKAMNINGSTFSRWLNGSGNPQPANLLKIIDCLPSHERENFIGMLKKAPELYNTIADRLSPDTSAHQTPHSEIFQGHLSSHIDADFYERVLSALEVTAPHLLYWSLCSLILRRALFELNAEPLGIEVSVLRCTPPQSGKIRSLYRDLAITLPEGSPPRGAGNVHDGPDVFFWH